MPENKDVVQQWFNNTAEKYGKFINSEGTTQDVEVFGNYLKVSENFEEYVVSMQISSKEQWLQIAPLLASVLESVDAKYHVDYFHERHATASFSYTYRFVGDQEEFLVEGIITGVWNENGELVAPHLNLEYDET